MDLKPARNAKKLLVSPKRLRRRISPRQLPGPKAYGKHRTHIIGQERAIESLQLGLRIESPGYNVFVSGPSGSGKMTTIRHVLAEFKQPRRPLCDYAYVHNFLEPDRPRLLMLEPGDGARLKKGMERLIKSLQRELPKALGTDSYHKERDRLLNDYQGKEHELVTAFQRKARRQGFALVEMQGEATVEHDVLPIIDGEPVPLSVLEEKVDAGQLSRQRFGKLAGRHQRLRTEMEQVARRTRSLARELNSDLEALDRRVGGVAIDNLIEELAEQFRAESVGDYLDEVKEFLLDRIPALAGRLEDEEGSAPGELMPDPFAPLQVNVVLTNAHRKGCPVVFEPSPTVARLLGTIERSSDDSGRVEIDFMSIRAGSLLRANGGFLLLKADDLLGEAGAWKILKQTLSTGQLEIRPPEGPLAMMSTGLKPDPIPLDVKIILQGDDLLYRALYLGEDDFKKTFKVKAEFDDVMECRASTLEKFQAFVQRVVQEEELLHPNRRAVAELVEEMIREAEDQQKLSTRFRVVADLLRESSYWARRAGRRTVTRVEIARAIRQRRRRVNLAEEKYREDIERNVVMVSTSGSRIGQVNGLAIFDLGDYSFGKPCRITASAGVGRQGVVNIEREAGLSGAIHDKGVYILGGFLADRFGRDFPLTLDARVCFEQSYSEIDGDSASSSEVYALLSCLAQVPLAQSIAVTGSINQHGRLQPIGGVNQKIEGFFDICQARGLDGCHGVIIPRGNLHNLMLRHEVVEAVRRGRFHVWAAATVDEGMELLTGVRAGRPGRRGVYPPGTINRLVADRLRRMAEAQRDFS